MTLLYCEGFEGVTTPYANRIFSSPSWRAGDMTEYTGRFGIGKAWGRPGSNTDSSGFYFDGTEYGYGVNLTYCIGFAMKRTNGSNSSGVYSWCKSGSYGTAWGVYMGNGYVRIKAWDSGQPSYDYIVPVGTWCYIEWKFRGHNSSGISIVRVNGTEIFNWGPGDTLYSTAGNFSGFYLASSAWTGWQIDDLYFLAVDGSGLNDFLGDCRVDTILANGAGNSTQMTPSAGANYECINDDPNDPNDYVEADVDAEKDTYAYPDVPTDLDDNNIYGVTIDHMAMRTQPVANVELRNVLRSNGVDYYGSNNWALADNTVGIKKDSWEKDPDDNGDWTQAKINAAEFGVELNKT